jgi:hypothetical protein
MLGEKMSLPKMLSIRSDAVLLPLRERTVVVTDTDSSRLRRSDEH